MDSSLLAVRGINHKYIVVDVKSQLDAVIEIWLKDNGINFDDVM